MVQSEQKPCKVFQTQRGLIQGISASKTIEKARVRAKVKWATLCQFHLCNCNPESQEAVLTIHREGNCRKPLPDHSCPTALRWLASGGCGSYFKHSPPSKLTHSHQCQRKEDFFSSRLTFQISWDGSHRLNDTQKPVGNGI